MYRRSNICSQTGLTVRTRSQKVGEIKYINRAWHCCKQMMQAPSARRSSQAAHHIEGDLLVVHPQLLLNAPRLRV